MKVIPRKIPTEFVSTVPEPDIGEGTIWNASTTYAANQYVVYEHEVYASIDSGNVNNIPSKTMNGTTAKWRNYGASNKYACFDLQNNTQSIATGVNIVIEYDVEFMDTVALLNVLGEWCRVDVFDKGELIPYWSSGNYSLVQDVDNEWDYEFLPIVRKGDVFFTNIPPCILGRVCITIHASGAEDDAAIGHLITGYSQDTGATLYGVTAGGRFFSKIEENEFGRVSIVKRNAAKRFNGEVWCTEQEVDPIMETFMALDAVPTLFIGDNRSGEDGGLRMLTVFGLLKTYEANVPSPGVAPITISIDGIA